MARQKAPIRNITREDFPHAALLPFDATPRITPEHAQKVADLVDQVRELGIGEFGPRPAIVVAVWQGALVKYLVDDRQVEETIQNLHKAIAKHHTTQAKEISHAED